MLSAGAAPTSHRLRPRPRLRLLPAAAVSLLLHAALLAALPFGLARQKPALAIPDSPATVELVMSPPGSSDADSPATTPPHEAPAKTPPPPASSEAEPRPAEPGKPQAAPHASPVPPVVPPAPAVTAPDAAMLSEAAPPAAEAALPLPPPAPPAEPTPPAAGPPAPVQPEAASPRAAAALPAAKPAPAGAPPDAAPAGAPAPQFSLGGIASDTNALVTGDLMVPPGADPTYRNRKPNYPPEAARRGEHGAVLLLVHVNPDGLVSGVDIAQSSGFRLLDQSARDTVLGWHFLPAVTGGRPIPFDMKLRIVFNLD